MPSSMIATILEIEREAESILAKAKADATALLEDAGAQRESNGTAYFLSIQDEISRLEADKAAAQARKVNELEAVGQTELSTINTISEETLTNAVNYIMKLLSGK